MRGFSGSPIALAQEETPERVEVSNFVSTGFREPFSALDFSPSVV
jgi:hypothetical protein